jgi:hypothetical protein
VLSSTFGSQLSTTPFKVAEWIPLSHVDEWGSTGSASMRVANTESFGVTGQPPSECTEYTGAFGAVTVTLVTPVVGPDNIAWLPLGTVQLHRGEQVNLIEAPGKMDVGPLTSCPKLRLPSSNVSTKIRYNFAFLTRENSFVIIPCAVGREKGRVPRDTIPA